MKKEKDEKGEKDEKNEKHEKLVNKDIIYNQFNWSYISNFQ